MDKLPMYFEFSLSMNRSAFDYYQSLDFETKNKINEYIQNTTSKEEEMSRIDESISSLSNSSTDFLFFL